MADWMEIELVHETRSLTAEERAMLRPGIAADASLTATKAIFKITLPCDGLLRRPGIADLEFKRGGKLELSIDRVARNESVPPVARPLDEWHEDYGPVTWWKLPVEEPAWIGTPLDSDWPGYHTHRTPHPAVPINADAKEAPND